jgi:hypothetical protein
LGFSEKAEKILAPAPDYYSFALSMLIIVAGGSALSPFIYSLF